MQRITDIPDRMTAEEIRIVSLEGGNFSALAEFILHSLPPTRTEVQKELQPYWLFRDETAITDRIAMKGRKITISTSLQDKALK